MVKDPRHHEGSPSTSRAAGILFHSCAVFGTRHCSNCPEQHLTKSLQIPPQDDTAKQVVKGEPVDAEAKVGAGFCLLSLAGRLPFLALRPAGWLAGCLAICLLGCLPVRLLACSPARLLACLPACLLACLPACLLACVPAGQTAKPCLCVSRLPAQAAITVEATRATFAACYSEGRMKRLETLIAFELFNSSCSSLL